MTTNPITGDPIATKPSSRAYRAGYKLIFGENRPKTHKQGETKAEAERKQGCLVTTLDSDGVEQGENTPRIKESLAD